MAVLNIYSDQDFLAPGRPHVVLLDPFWGKNLEDALSPSHSRFDCYAKTGNRFFRLTSWDQADLVVIPHDWMAGSPNEQARRLSEKARGAGKPAVIFFNHDSEEKIEAEGAYVFRTSFTQSRRTANEFAFPAWHEDFVSCYLGGKLPLRPKKAKPQIGYCGYTASERAIRQERWVAPLRKRRGGYRLLRALGIGINDHRGVSLRSEAVFRLSQSPLVETNFLRRQAFWNGAFSSRPDPAFVQQTRREFVQNMVNSDYMLCARGAGNFSYRLYETLSCGRIPVFINTDCVLPYEPWIDWRKVCVWIEEQDMPHIAERVAAFHDRLSPHEFEERQRECRRLWEEWISPTGFFQNFYRHFQ